VEKIEKAQIIFQAQDISKVMLSTGEITTAKLSGKFRHQTQNYSKYPVVGDYVKGKLFEDLLIIESILERKSFLQRKVSGNRVEEQGIAANIDQVFIITSLNEEFNLSRLDRYVTIVWDSGALPIILLTKKDLITKKELAKIEGNLKKHFSGIPVFTATMFEEIGIELKEYFAPSTISAFIGSSGVGKSTLINKLLASYESTTSTIREKDGKGRHTTTNRQLFYLENGAMIIDTPGMREVGIETVKASSLEHQFEEISILAKKCRLSDCKHLSEPGCMVKKSINDGTLDVSIFVSYKKMLKELTYLKEKEKYQEIQLKKKMTKK
jgi:ribosome biogenesis GTPase